MDNGQRRRDTACTDAILEPHLPWLAISRKVLLLGPAFDFTSQALQTTTLSCDLNSSCKKTWAFQMILREPLATVELYFRQHFSTFAPRCETAIFSVLPESGKPFKIRRICEREGLELADALLQNTNITYLQFGTATYTKSFLGEAMAKYVRASKRLKRFGWNLTRSDRVLQQPYYFLLHFKKVPRSRN